MALELKGIGRLTKDVELEKKNTKSGEMDFCRLNVAFDNGKDKEGNSRDATFLTFECWGKQAINHSKYIGKGSQISIDAIVLNNNFTKDDRQKVYGQKYIANKVEYLSNKKSVETESGTKTAEEELPF